MELDYFAPDLTGERFHKTINALRRETWLAKSDLGWFVLDREAGSFFLRTKSATFPGLRIAEMFGVEEGRCSRRCAATSSTSTARATGASAIS